MTAHTPGPWLVQGNGGPEDGYNVLDTRDRYIAFVDDSSGMLSDEQAHMNARLIAAAPEMFAALTATVSAMEAQEELVELTALGDFGTHESDARRAAIEQMNGLFVQEIRALLARIDGTS